MPSRALLQFLFKQEINPGSFNGGKGGVQLVGVAVALAVIIAFMLFLMGVALFLVLRSRRHERRRREAEREAAEAGGQEPVKASPGSPILELPIIILQPGDEVALAYKQAASSGTPKEEGEGPNGSRGGPGSGSVSSGDGSASNSNGSSEEGEENAGRSSSEMQEVHTPYDAEREGDGYAAPSQPAST